MSTERQPRPGPFPHRLVWRGWKTVAGLVFVAILFAAVQSENRYFLGVTITLMGVGVLLWALRHDRDRIREEARYTRGPGWWIGWLASKLPGAGAKIVFTLLSLGIIALGVATLAGA